MIATIPLPPSRGGGEPIAEAGGMLFDAVLNDLGAVPDVSQVAVDPSHEITFYGLQVATNLASKQLAEAGVPIHDLGPELCDWGATAATLVELDLVIAVDCSVADLAGALGRPVWICLPVAPEWRWMLKRTDTPWYGSARLFRQSRAGDWSSVFERSLRSSGDRVNGRGRVRRRKAC